MSAKQRKQLLQNFGVASVEDLRDPAPAGSRMAVERALLRLPHVKGAEMIEHPGWVGAVLTLRWWAWLTFGYLHKKTRARARQALHETIAASVGFGVFY